MKVVIIDKNGEISDKDFTAKYISDLSQDDNFIHQNIAEIKEDEMTIIAISSVPEKTPLNKSATELCSVSLHGDVMIIGWKNNSIENIDFDYLAASLISSVKIKKEVSWGEPEMMSELIHSDYSDYSDEFPDERGYDSY